MGLNAEVEGKGKTHMDGTVTSRRAILACLGALMLTSSAAAGGYGKKDFTLRFPAALSRFSSYGDVAGAGGASAASKWSSSVNPASSAWLRVPSRFRLSPSPQFSSICFASGTRIHVMTESLTWESENAGTFLPALAQIRSNRDAARNGFVFDLDMDFYQMQWARRVGQRLAVGANFNFTQAQTRFDLGDFHFSKTVSETYGFRFGGLWEPVDNLRVGVVFDYALSPARTTMRVPAGPVTLLVKDEDTTYQYLLRPGVSLEYAEDSAVFLDYQYGAFINDTGHLEVHRFCAGVDHRVFKWLFIRGGAVFDSRSNCAWTVGVGLYPTDWFTIDLAYQDDLFPELAAEFGRSRVLTLSLGFRF